MQPSESKHPDLDWSQVRETIKLLAVSVAQVEHSMKIGDESVNVLTDTFASMVDDLSAIQDILGSQQPSAQIETALARCQTTQGKVSAAIVAFQFYDRLQQCLGHVANGLQGLSAIIDNPLRLYNPLEWEHLKDDIRGRYTMESEKAMFDAILQGKSLEEALTLLESTQADDGNGIELF
jgi:hypothetical protein